MNKQEFLEEVGRLAERLFPEGKKPIPYSREWWGRNVDERPEDIPEEMILAFARGEPVWNCSIKIDRPDATVHFYCGVKNYSLTDPSLPKKYRPWTWADRGLVPDRLIRKCDPAQQHRLVTHVTRDGLWMSGGFCPKFTEIFEYWTQPDGSPCGVEVTE